MRVLSTFSSNYLQERKKKKGLSRMSIYSFKARWKAWRHVPKATDKAEVKAHWEIFDSERMLHAHIKYYSTHSTAWPPADGTDEQQWAPLNVMGELLLNIACQNKFTPFKGLGFTSLHHKPHYNSHLLSWKDTTLDLKLHTRWEGRYDGSNNMRLGKINTTSA